MFSIQNFIDDNYYIISNVSQIEDAEVICLGEVHGHDQIRKNNALIIDHFFYDSLTVLVENIELNIPPISKQTYFVKNPIREESWDIKTQNFSFKKALFKATLIGLISFFLLSRAGINIWPFFTTFVILFISKNFIEQLYFDMVPRNQNMGLKIEEKSAISEARKKVIVVGGKKHFSESKDLPDRVIDLFLSSKAIQSKKKAVHEIHEYLKTKKFIILIPKQDYTFVEFIKKIFQQARKAKCPPQQASGLS